MAAAAPPVADPGTTRAAGVLAAGAALGAAELVGLALPGHPSLVLAVVNGVVSATPAAVREPLLSVVGTLDKPLLVAGVVAVVLSLGAVAARRSTHRPWESLVWFPFVAAAAVAASAAGPAPHGVASVVAPAAVGAVVGVASLWWMVPATRPWPADPVEQPVAAPLSRRQFLARAGAAALLPALALAGLGATRRRAEAAVEAFRGRLRLPAPTRAAPPLPAGATPEVPGLPPAVTPAGDFYLIDTLVAKPVVDVSTWTLTVTGRVRSPLTLTYRDLLAMPQTSAYVTLACVSNPVGGPLVGNALWQGVPLADLLDRAGVDPSAEQLMGVSVDGFRTGFPVGLALDGRPALVALAMNRAPLTVAHGFPARLVVPGLYGYVSATKWLAELQLNRFADDTPYWVVRGWSADGTIQAASRIDVPREGATVPAGHVVVAGRAWHQHVGIGSVQVSADDGPWLVARLAPSLGVDAWRLWTFTMFATPGRHRLRVRTLDPDGTPQSGDVQPVFPGPSSGYDAVSFTVASPA